MSRRLKILLVANSVPLPDSDFLKHKLFHLSDTFDLHMICWGDKATRDKFYEKYSDRIAAKNVHLFYNQLNTITIIGLVIKTLLHLILSPAVSFPLLGKMMKTHGWNVKKLLLQFSHYYPIARLKPDVVHFEFGTLAQRFSDIKEYVNCKTSTSFRGYDINYVGLDTSGYYGEVWKHFDGFHFLGEDLKNRALLRGYHPEKVEALIPPGVDVSLFNSDSTRSTNEKLVILSVGRLTWKKGYEYGLKAVSLLKESGVDFEYRIVGDGNHKQAVLFAISELGLEKEVKLLGSLTTPQLKKEYEEAHVLLHPAVSEGFCNAVLEAQAMGLPVVTTDADGLGENVEDGVTGFVVPVYDAVALAEKLKWCADNRETLIKIGNAGIERVRLNFTVQQQMGKFEMFYKKVYEG